MVEAVAVKQVMTRVAAIKTYFKDAKLAEIKQLTDADKQELSELIAVELGVEIQK
jgi:hypothetical protein